MAVFEALSPRVEPFRTLFVLVFGATMRFMRHGLGRVTRGTGVAASCAARRSRPISGSIGAVSVCYRQDDPEQRIAELERQLADQTAYQREPIVSPMRILPSHAITNLIVTLCVLLSAVSAGCTMTPGHPSTRDVQVPNVTGQLRDDAIAALQNLGFVVQTQQKADPSITPGTVISTDPPAGATAGPGSKVKIYVSAGPEQREVPDVTGLSFDNAREKLLAAGFSTVQRVPSPSTLELKDHVISTSPPAHQTASVTAVITIYVGTGS